MSMHPGDSWPGGVFGEVVSPSGKRSYLTATVVELLGKTSRWATGLASSGKIETERGKAVNKQGGERWFFIADSFEAYGTAKRWWPPPARPAPVDVSEWAELFRMQGADLEAVRAAVVGLEQQCEELRRKNSQLIAERAELYSIVERLARLGGSAGGHPGTDVNEQPRGH